MEAMDLGPFAFNDYYMCFQLSHKNNHRQLVMMGILAHRSSCPCFTRSQFHYRL